MANCKACESEGRAGVAAHRMTVPATCQRHFDLYMAGTHTLSGKPVEAQKRWTPPALDDDPQPVAEKKTQSPTLAELVDATTQKKAEATSSNPKRKRTMIDPGTAEQVRKAWTETDLSAVAIAQKFGVSEPTVRNKCKGLRRPLSAAPKTAKARSSQPARKEVVARPAAQRANGNYSVAQVLADLRTKRDVLNKAIEAIESLEAL